MAPSYRSTRNVRSLSGLGTVKEEGRDEPTTTATTTTTEKTESRPSAWERRRRRLQKKKVDASERKKAPEAATTTTGIDPYESDPGESYREHCLKFKGVGTKSCLGIPKFLLAGSNKTRSSSAEESSTVLTAPPSPLASDMGDLFGAVPASLPSNMTRVRYSLRSSITDGSEKQPVGPSVMERRDLRPNNVHLNVSHWSDEGGRPYMEDRYVICVFLGVCVFDICV